MLDYKDIITKHYGLGMSGMAIAKSLNASPSGVNDFLRAFKECKSLGYPLPQGITNYGIAEAVYGKNPAIAGRDLSYEMPNYEAVAKDMSSRKNMTLVVLWNRYAKKCRDCGLKFYSYRQFCENYAKWCDENKETLHFNAVIGQKMEVDFAGKTFQMVDPLTGEVLEIVVFVAVLPYSQYIYAEGMLSTKEPQWIAVNNNALAYFGGVPALVVCDNCKQAVIANRDWISPELNKDYAEWAEYNHTVILPAKVKKPKYKSSVENAVGILEKGFFHDMEEMDYFFSSLNLSLFSLPAAIASVLVISILEVMMFAFIILSPLFFILFCEVLCSSLDVLSIPLKFPPCVVIMVLTSKPLIKIFVFVALCISDT